MQKYTKEYGNKWGRLSKKRKIIQEMAKEKKYKIMQSYLVGKIGSGKKL